MKRTKRKRKLMIGSLNCKACGKSIDPDYDVYLCPDCLDASLETYKDLDEFDIDDVLYEIGVLYG